MSDFKSKLRSAWASAWDQGDVDAFDSIMSPDYTLLNSNSGDAGTVDDLKRQVLQVRSAFPDLSTTIEQVIVEGNDYAIFWTTTGTFSAPLGDVPATEQRVHTRGSVHGHIRDGLIIREEVTWDLRDLLTDVGIPTIRSALEKSGESLTFDATGQPTIDTMKSFNQRFVTGVTVVTTTDERGRPLGLAVNAYASVSLDPPLVLVCVQKTSSTYPSLFRSTHLGISILGCDQRNVLDVFATKSDDKFTNLAWHSAPAGSPLIDGSAAGIEAEIKERFQAKTHTVFMAKVTHVEVSESEPMIYKGGQVFDSRTLTAL
ncbi:flavin reductase [Gordonia terrae]|uniref:Flavin reductase n=1 Tax=Gordonia terrae TaxID=2055 RepID=A0A2I1R4V1_9ACTN|nr:flavin reductase [Gordonia terrae]PKZ64138.1 flavin reductase [Gordonia terrae]